MVFNTSQINLNVVLLVLLGISNKVDFIMAHQCYVCGPKANISCDKFDPTDKTFIKECPSAQACSIQTHGNLVERSCEEIGIRDCKTANNVQYCFCSENLCNGKTINFTDDEDLNDEGSGVSVITNTIQKEHKTIHTASQSSQVQLYFCSTWISILAILCN
ncbi:uncharacterized protein LOC103314647 isoform X1 [Tribolium castaneum]|uniref:Protein quiver n=2 Tax=Tribolium castaneum TaxID=7070 RepID=D6W7J1_TRICA|nr:PREDICTED: uncharacterized protein LOC103314647 isoform X1 [Tribolium castaneum]EFA11277.2 hypothetical protein TcasGA2_TC010812 [Tribolium castaneum]|eukprot:XP_008199368.1 PREDICTED: uncharacterized protein LOC103314647 isoform X1 [Tribolium castaneum]